MNLAKYLNRIERIDQLIRLRATGTPKEFSQKLGISQSVLFDTLAYLKELGAPIVYCKCSETYYYTENIEIKFSVPKLTFKKEEVIIENK